MAVLQDQDIRDLATGTLKRLGRLRFSQIAQNRQNYEIMGRLLRKNKVQFEDGIGIQRNVMTEHSGAARMTGLHEVDNVNITDHMRTIDIPWRHTTVAYAWERREMLTNRGFSRIYDLLQARRTERMISLVELMEQQGWDLPDSATNKLDVFGFPYWIVSDTTEGFNGTEPSAFSTNGVGNLLTSVAPNWKNYTFQYAAVSKDDLISKMRTMYRKIRFKSPVDVPDYRHGVGDMYRVYVNETTIKEMEDLGENQNENLGRDLATMDGVMTFRRNPVIWVPELDENEVYTDPVYMVNLNYFYPVFLKGDYLRETEPRQAPNQHNTWQVHIDLTWNMLCTDRRRQGVGTK